MKFKLVSRETLRQSWIFVCLPVLVGVLGVMQICQHPVAYYRTADPAYAYLMNGLTMATGSFDIGHTDNPGTTVQVFETVVIRFVYLFRSAPSVSDDVIANPELYIKAGRIGMLVINTLLMVWLGVFVWIHSGKKKWLALGMQTLLFFSQYLIIYFTLLMPEAFLISGGIVLSGICIRFLHEAELTHKRKIYYALAFAVVTGFLVVTKFPAVVLFMIPLALLSGNLYKLIYLVSTFLVAAILVVPARRKIGHFFEFIYGILTHKGQYGKGESGFIDSGTFSSNLHTHYIHNKIYFWVLALCLLFIIIGFIRYKKWMQPQAYKFRLLAGILIAALLNLTMASKAFAYHYLLAVETQIALAVFTMVLILSSVWPALKIKLAVLTKPAIQFALVGAFSLMLLYPQTDYYKISFQRQDQSDEVIREFKKYDQLPAVFSTWSCNGASPVCGYIFGMAFSGNIRQEFAEYIVKYYPNNWYYTPENGLYHNFIEKDFTMNMVKRYPQFLFYIHTNDTTATLPELKKLESLTDSSGSYVSTRRVYVNQYTGEQLWLITADTARARKQGKPIATITSDFETTQGDSVFITTVGNVNIDNADLRNTTHTRSGKWAMAFSNKQLYAGGIDLPVAKGMSYEVSIWCKGNTLKRSLSVKASFIDHSQLNCVERTSDGWEKLTLRFTVPQYFEEKTVRLFLCVYDDKNETVWWDDLEINVFQ